MSDYLKNINFKLYEFKNVILEPFRDMMLQIDGDKSKEFHHRFSHCSRGKFKGILKTVTTVPENTIRLDFDDAYFVGISTNFYHMLVECLPKLNGYFTNRDETILLNKNFIDLYPGLYDILNDYLQFKNIQFVNYEGPDKLSRITNQRFFIKNLKQYASTNANVIQAFNEIKNLSVHFWQKYMQENFTPVTPFRKIYINRTIKGELQKRLRCGNQNEIYEQLKKKDFELLDPNETDLKTAIKMCYEAKEIVGVHGAGLTNILFSQPGTKFTQLVHYMPDESMESIYKRLSDIIGLKYNAIYGLNKENEYATIKEVFYITQEQIKGIK
jgi:hypothetical protein